MALPLVPCSVQTGGLRLLLLRAGTPQWVRAVGSSASLPETTSSSKLPTEKDLHVVRTLPMLYRMFVKGYYKRLHELQVYDKQLYGPLYKVNAGGLISIAIASAELMEEILRKDAKFPSRGDMTIWTEYRDMRGIGYGPFTEEGEKWYKLRAILNKRMLHPSDSMKYAGMMNDVITDFIKRIYFLRQNSPTGDMVVNISNELYRFALEGISSILFETRIGCLEKEIPKETQDFIDSIAAMFTYSFPVVFLPRWTRNIFPFWRRYIAGWEGIFIFSKKLIDMKMEDIQKRLDRGQEVKGEYLTYLLSSNILSSKDVYGSIAELLLAGVDTTSNTLMWTFYLLSRNPKVQETLYQEVCSYIPGDSIPTAEIVTRMPYLKSVIKEALRLYPVVPVNARIMNEQEVVIGGHLFPKNTTFTLFHYAISQDERTFPEPQKFKPERWLRDGRIRPNPFGSIPFGFGVRGCAGRRIAELEMYLALSRKPLQVAMSKTARLLVVGAGLAGLAAAATLFESGFQNVQVLEATEKHGGRIDTTRPFGPDIIELGANWIHGQEGNPLYSLAKEHGLLHEDPLASIMCLPTSFTPEDYFFREDGQQLDPVEVERVCALFGQLTTRAFSCELEDRFLSKSLGHYLDEAFAEDVLANSSREAQQIFEWCKRSECTDEASSSLYEVSASQIGHYVALQGGFFNTLGSGGYQALLDLLMRNFPAGVLLYSKPVQQIRWTCGKGVGPPVRVVCEDGQEYEADHVIVTASLGFLKEKASTLFEPPLPATKVGAIKNLGFGTVDKIFLQFEHRFWPEDCAGIQLVWDQGPEDAAVHASLSQGEAWRDTWYKKICGFDVVARHPTVLCGWITGREAEHMETLTEEDVGEVCVRLLQTFTSWPVQKPTRVLVTKWRHHPYACGSYTYIPCGVDAVKEHQALAEPLPLDPVPAMVKPLQVLFAGEATHVNFYTTTHGAYITGVREAQRLINYYADHQ
ncbi:hypothetical protein GN956_G13456 [Arapaima gigas]